MGSALSSFPSVVGSVLSSFCSPSLLPLPLAPPPSSPSPPTPSQIKYDVFLSFRGEDTRDKFTSHVDKAFRDNGIDHFIDYHLRRGDEISSSLLQAIEESRISVVIFSENYADSTWCLEELVKILECKENHGQIVIPIFYEIDPSDVRKQTGSYATAFARHQKRFKRDLDKVQKWKKALNDAANISGSDSRVVKPESKLVENIVEDVLKSLKENTLPHDNKELIGIDSSITELETMIGRGCVGIWGIGGIGKTTLANVLYEKFSCQFDGSYFADSVREASKQHYGLNYLQRRLFSKLLGDKNAHIGMFRTISQRKKFLIVLDDVSSYEQVKSLVGDPRCLDSKCQIIITSRNKQVLRNCCLDDNTYEVKELCFDDALKLFCRNAFRQNCPSIDYEELSNSIVKMVGGVPLALTVLGCSLLRKKKEVWGSVMEKLEKNFDRDIHEVLKISYEELDDNEQNIFLDIACFFRWCDIDLVKAFLKACDFFPECGMDALIDKSLITISENMLTMHDLLQAMGREIVRKECTNAPGKRSRLWHHKDIIDVLTNGTGTDRLEGISLNMSKSEDIDLHFGAFANMPHLRFLNFYTSNRFLDSHISNDRVCKNRVNVAQGLQFYFTQLKYLHWYGCPLKSLQSHFHPKNLVNLEMQDSEVRELWSGVPYLDNMKRIDLSGSQNLTSLPDLSRALSLEYLILHSCRSLTEIPSSIGYLPKLQALYLSSCTSLTRIPSMQHLPKLHFLDLNDCISLTEIPSSIQYLSKLRWLQLNGCENLTRIPDCSSLKSLEGITLIGCSALKVLPRFPNNLGTSAFRQCRSLCEVPSSFKYLNNLRSLLFEGCESLTSIPDYSGLKSLTKLEIISYPKVKMLPEFPNTIEELVLADIPIEELPSSLENLCRLRTLYLNGCSRLKSIPSSGCKWKPLTQLLLNNCSQIDKLPDALGTLKSLERIEANGTALSEVFPSLIGLDNLSTLSLCDCGITEIPNSLGCLTSLRFLHLDNNNFESIPISIINLGKLQKLSISYCKRLKVLPKLPWADVIAVNCVLLEEISCPSFHNDMFAPRLYYHVMVADLRNCFKLDRKSLNKFVKGSLLEIKDQASSNKKSFHHQVHCIFAPPITIQYPDSEIPAWFNYQNSGSNIDVKLPPNWFNFNFLWVALCMVVAPDSQYADDGINEFVKYECTIKSEDGDRLVTVPPTHKPAFGRVGISRSKHVAIALGFNFYRKRYGKKLSFQFYLNKPNGYLVGGQLVEGVNVEKCGVHLIYGVNKIEVEDDYRLDVSNDEDEPHLEVSSEDDEPYLLKSDEEDESHSKRF